jgi:hypothetical protein
VGLGRGRPCPSDLERLPSAQDPEREMTTPREWVHPLGVRP